MSSQLSIRYPGALYSDQLNRSSSKMLYSFSKGRRFNTIKSNCSGDYNILTSATKRSTSFGYGNKNHLSSSTLSIPGPNHYHISIENRIGGSREKGITFGSSRQKVRNNSFINYSSRLIPGPGDYSPKRVDQVSIKYSLGEKYNTPNSKKYLPGPSHYKIPDFKNSLVLSQNKSYGGTKFSKLPRMMNPEKVVPGPGAYEMNRSMKMISKYSVSGACRFTGRRKTGGIYEDRRNPGPGLYNHYTEFRSKQV